MNAVERAFPQKKLVIKSDLCENKYWILADGFLTELFFNILHNAAKFDRNEEVIVKVDVKEERKTGLVKVEIKDQGPGIPDTDKKKILTRLIQREKNIWGSGIGLTLVARIAERYDAKIWVKDRVKDEHIQGAMFIIEFQRGEPQ